MEESRLVWLNKIRKALIAVDILPPYKKRKIYRIVLIYRAVVTTHGREWLRFLYTFLFWVQFPKRGWPLSERLV